MKVCMSGLLLHVKICHWLLGQLNWVGSSLFNGILTLHPFLLGQEWWGWLQAYCNLLVHSAVLISCLGMAFALQRSFVAGALLVWVFPKLIRASGHVLLLSSLRTKHHLHRSWAIKGHETVQVPNTTQTAAWENDVSHRGCWIRTHVWSVFLTCLSEPCWCLPQRELFGRGHFPPKLYSLQEIENVLFLRICLCLTLITKGRIFPLSLVTHECPRALSSAVPLIFHRALSLFTPSSVPAVLHAEIPSGDELSDVWALFRFR